MSITDHFPTKKIYLIENIEYIRNSKEYYKANFILAKNAKRILLTPLYLDDKNLSVKLLDYYKKKENIRIFRSIKLANFFIFSLRNTIKNIISVFHSKIYIFDKNLILTSANMNYKYFKEIEDRYFIIRVPEMAADIYNQYINYKRYNVENEIFKGSSDKLIYAGFPNIEKFNKKIFSFTENEEKDIITKLLSIYSEDEIYISTPYCNFPSYYDYHFKKIKNLKILLPAASINTHQNFFFEWLIKYMYSASIYFLHRKFPDKIYLLKKNQYNQLYHKKGIWIFAKNKTISIIGSSSYNHRSNYRDNELTFLIESTDINLNKIFRNEVDNLKNRIMQKQICRPFFVFAILYLIFYAFL